MNVLKLELKRAFFNRRLAIALLCLLAIVAAHIATSVIPASLDQSMYIELTGYPLSVFNRWIGGWPGTVYPALYFFLVPLMVCVPFSDSLYEDAVSGWREQIASPSPRVFGVKIRCDVFGRRARSQYTVDCRFFLDGNVPAIRRTECRIRPFSNFSILDVGRCLLQQHISIQCVVLASHSRNLRASRLHSPLFITYFGKPLDRTMFFSFYMYNSYIYFWNRIDCLAVASIVHAPRPAAMGFKI